MYTGILCVRSILVYVFTVCILAYVYTVCVCWYTVYCMNILFSVYWYILRAYTDVQCIFRYVHTVPSISVDQIFYEWHIHVIYNYYNNKMKYIITYLIREKTNLL